MKGRRRGECARSSSMAFRMGAMRLSARDVGTIPWLVRTSNGSPSERRSRASVLLTAGWLSPTRRAARVTLRSVTSASRTSNDFRSISVIFTI